MRILLFLSGLLSFVVGIIVIGTIKTDIQVQIVATCLIGAMLLFGQVVIIGRVNKLTNMVKEIQDRKSP